MDEGSREEALIRKLVETWHLNVPGRRALPLHEVRGSRIVAAIADLVEESGWYPVSWRPDMGFDGGLIEKRSHDLFLVHWKREVGVLRFETVETLGYNDRAKACEAYARRFFGDSIDGVPINWQT